MSLLALTAALPSSFASWLGPDSFVRAHADAVELTVPMPGIRKEDVTVEVDGRRLLVRGQARRDGFADVVRAYALNFDPDVARSSAMLQDGVLELRLARANQAARIEVR